jgi:hypothetical protein
LSAFAPGSSVCAFGGASCRQGRQGRLFLIDAPFAMLGLVSARVCVLFIGEVPLRMTIERVDEAVMDDELVSVGVAR